MNEVWDINKIKMPQYDVNISYLKRYYRNMVECNAWQLRNDDDELSCKIADQRKCVKRLLLLRKVLFEPLTIAAKYLI